MSNADAAVAEFLRDFWGSGTHLLSDDADIFDSFGIEGDDASEFIERFATQFKIDTSNYRWYFHHGEEGFVNVGAWLFKPPYRRVDRTRSHHKFSPKLFGRSNGLLSTRHTNLRVCVGIFGSIRLCRSQCLLCCWL